MVTLSVQFWNAVTELVNTERDYFRDLRAVVEVRSQCLSFPHPLHPSTNRLLTTLGSFPQEFLGPLLESGLMSQEDADAVFLNVPLMVKAGRPFLVQLQELKSIAVEAWMSQAPAPPGQEFMPALRKIEQVFTNQVCKASFFCGRREG
jgi:hypothetical protein